MYYSMTKHPFSSVKLSGTIQISNSLTDGSVMAMSRIGHYEHQSEPIRLPCLEFHESHDVHMQGEHNRWTTSANS
jgi:hypothetical protein